MDLIILVTFFVIQMIFNKGWLAIRLSDCYIIAYYRQFKIMNNSKPNFFSKPVDGKYSIQQKLKSGGFGAVYTARDVKEPSRVLAVKLMPMSAKKYAQIELHLYEQLQKHKVTTGFVKFYDNGAFMEHKYLVMELISTDLEDLKKQSRNERMSVKTVLMIGLQVVDRLEALHRIGYLHRDVKPDNLAIGLSEKSKVIYLFDFGLAHLIGAQRPQEEKGKVVGTLGFMSCRAHEGKDLGPADDIQSLVYTLLYLAEGSLPWLKLQVKTSADFHKILLAKRALSKRSFKNHMIPEELFMILQQMQRTKPSQSIDYLKIKYRLLDCLKQMGEVNDFAFDWLSPTDRKKEPLSPLKKKGESPQDERRNNKKLQIMNEENQQLVQNEIYQVYKFMEGEGAKKEKKERGKSKSPPKQKIEQPKGKEVKPPAAKARPVSAANRPKPPPAVESPWQKILSFQNSNNVSGPRIVINKTAKHKI